MRYQSDRTLKTVFPALIVGVVVSLAAGLLGSKLGMKALPLIIAALGCPWLLAKPHRAFMAYLVAVPLSTAFEGVVGTGVTKLLFLVLVLAWVPSLRGRRIRTTGDVFLWGALFILACLASSLGSSAPGVALSNTARLAGYLLFVVIATDILKQEQALIAGIIAILAPAIPFVALGAYQFLTHRTFLGLGLHSQTGDFVVWKGHVQAGAVFEHPNVFATYLILYICLSLGLGLFVSSYRNRLLLVLVAAASFGGLLLTLSRSGWVGFAASALVFVLVYPKFLRLGFILAIVVLLLVLVLPEKEVSGLARRTTPQMDASTMARLGAYKSAWKMFTDHPIVGVGLGSFNKRFLEYKVPESRFPKNYIRGSERGMEAHSTYLQLLAETGMFGLIAFIGLNLSILHRLILLLKRNQSGFMKGLSVGLTAAFAGLVIQNGLNSQEYIKAFWVTIALISGMGEIGQSETSTIDIENMPATPQGARNDGRYQPVPEVPAP